jgi:hypothetical protein
MTPTTDIVQKLWDLCHVVRDNESLKYLFPIEPTERAVAASGDGIMLTKLSQFQAQGWEKWLSRITFTRGTDSLKPTPIGINSYLAITVLSPGSGYGSNLTEL